MLCSSSAAEHDTFLTLLCFGCLTLQGCRLHCLLTVCLRCMLYIMAIPSLCTMGGVAGMQTHSLSFGAPLIALVQQMFSEEADQPCIKSRWCTHVFAAECGNASHVRRWQLQGLQEPARRS
jgi:hypothetical protein